METWLEKDSSTAGQVQAFSKGLTLWDREMNRVYASLLKALPAEEREILKISQRQWITYRDANLAALRAVFSRAQGTLYRPLAVSQEMETVKARALLLRACLDAAESGG